MNIRHITTAACPHCSARVRGEAVEGTHTNGQQFETRTFECGHIVAYVPNFRAEQVKYECPKSEARIDRLAKRQKIANKLIKLLEDSDADAKFKGDLTSEIMLRAELR